MSHCSPTIKQQELLTEDLAQIRRYFPGAEIIEAFEIPFFIETRDMRQESRVENTPLRGNKNRISDHSLSSERNDRSEKNADGNSAKAVNSADLVADHNSCLLHPSKPWRRGVIHASGVSL